nr:immunoglobulin light chain junction region [Macaca mulatta]MOV73342.1 immunoglobulin light chain junction region [Macaca mulatta]
DYYCSSYAGGNTIIF